MNENDYEMIQVLSSVLKNRAIFEQKRLREERFEQLSNQGFRRSKMTKTKTSPDEFKQREDKQLQLLVEKINVLLKNKLNEYEDKKDHQLFKQRELEQEKIILSRLQNVMRKEFSKQTADFLTHASHELKTPLVPVLAYVDMLLGDHFSQLNEKQRQCLEIVRTNVISCLENTSKVYDYQRLFVDNSKLDKKNEDLRKIIQNVISEFKQHVEEKQIKIIFEHDKERFILCHADRIAQVLKHLLKNSIEACLQGQGKIILLIEEIQDQFVIVIEDNGKGMSEKKLKKIFFDSATVKPTTTPNLDSMGFGIAISKLIIDKHGGKIWAESKIGQGTSVKIALPKGFSFKINTK